MSKYALYVPLEAKPGKEKEVADFLRSAVIGLSHYLPEGVWGQPELCAAITAEKNSAAAFIATGTCTFVLRRA